MSRTPLPRVFLDVGLRLCLDGFGLWRGKSSQSALGFGLGCGFPLQDNVPVVLLVLSPCAAVAEALRRAPWSLAPV